MILDSRLGLLNNAAKPTDLSLNNLPNSLLGTSSPGKRSPRRQSSPSPLPDKGKKRNSLCIESIASAIPRIRGGRGMKQKIYMVKCKIFRVLLRMLSNVRLMGLRGFPLHLCPFLTIIAVTNPEVHGIGKKTGQCGALKNKYEFQNKTDHGKEPKQMERSLGKVSKSKA